MLCNFRLKWLFIPPFRWSSQQARHSDGSSQSDPGQGIFSGGLSTWRMQISTLLLLLIYLLTLLENMVIISTIDFDHQFHTSKYFFLSHLPFLDILFTLVISPKIFVRLMLEIKAFLVATCESQPFSPSSWTSFSCFHPTWIDVSGHLQPVALYCNFEWLIMLHVHP